MHRRRAERKLVCRIGRSHRDDSLFSFPTYEFRRRAGEVLSEGSEPQEFVNSVCNAGEEGSLEITDRRAGRRERERWERDRARRLVRYLRICSERWDPRFANDGPHQ